MWHVARCSLIYFALAAIVGSSAQAQLGVGLNSGPAATGPVSEPFTVRAELLPPANGNPGQLAVTVEIAPGWHIYSTTQPAGGPIATKITAAGDHVRLAGDFQPDREPVRHPEPAFDNLAVETYEGKVTWRAPLEIAAGADLAIVEATGKLKAQACTERNCLPPKSISFVARLTTTAAATDNPRPEKPVMTEPQASASASAATLGKYTHDQTHVTLHGSVAPRVVRPGSKAVVTLRAEPAAGYHFYALAERDAQSGSKPTLIHVAAQGGSAVVRPASARSAPVMKPNPDGSGDVAVYKSPIEFHVEVVIPASAQPGQLAINGQIGFQSCQGDSNCDRPHAAQFVAHLMIGPEEQGGSLPLEFSTSKYAVLAREVAGRPEATIQATQGVTPGMPLKPTSPPPTDMTALPLMLFFSLCGGFILNFMPCVLPVIGLKIQSFVNQAGSSRAEVWKLNLWYTAGILAVFMGLATAASAASLGIGETNLGWGQQFSSPVFTIAMAAVVFTFALSFLGVWEIPLPGFVGSGAAQELAAREGPAGAFAKGLLTTVLATPCSGPFLGPVFGFTVSQPPAVTYLIYACIGLGMASPYLILGAFPQWLRFLPKPGAWMDTFKQLMGFVLLGAVVFLFTSLKHDYVVPTFGLLVGLWMACWFVGRTPLYAGTASLLRAYAGGAVIAAAIGVFVFQVLLPGPALLPWRPYSPQTLTQLTSEGRTVLVDFSAEWCLTCKTNLKFAVNRQQVAEIVAANGVVPLLADWTDGSDEVTDALAALGSKSIPVLAIYPAGRPDQPIVLRDLISMNQLLEALEQAGPSKLEGGARNAKVEGGTSEGPNRRG